MWVIRRRCLRHDGEFVMNDYTASPRRFPTKRYAEEYARLSKFGMIDVIMEDK